jgi:hypothetical protein
VHLLLLVLVRWRCGLCLPAAAATRGGRIGAPMRRNTASSVGGFPVLRRSLRLDCCLIMCLKLPHLHIYSCQTLLFMQQSTERMRRSLLQSWIAHLTSMDAFDRQAGTRH